MIIRLINVKTINAKRVARNMHNWINKKIKKEREKGKKTITG